MSNSDFSHVNLTQKKAAQTQFAGQIAAAGDAATTPGLVRIGGGKDANVAIQTSVGATVAGATKVGADQPVAATSALVTTYSLAKTILARGSRQ